MRTLYFCPVVSCSFFFFFFFFSSPDLSRRRLDVYHTICLPHDVALVRIWNACLKCAARGSLKIQDAKNRQKSPSGHHRTTLSGYLFATRACVDNRKKTVKQQYLPHMLLQCGELRPTNSWDLFGSWGHPSKFQRVSRLAFVTAATSLTGGQTDDWPSPGLLHYIYIFAGSCPVTEFCQVQKSLCVQVLRSPILAALAALLHGTGVVGVSFS